MSTCTCPGPLYPGIVVIVGTDPETWRAADRMIDDAQGADS